MGYALLTMINIVSAFALLIHWRFLQLKWRLLGPNYIDSRKEQPAGIISQTTQAAFPQPKYSEGLGRPHHQSLSTCLQERPNSGLKDHGLTHVMCQDPGNRKQSFIRKGHCVIGPLSRKLGWMSGHCERTLPRPKIQMWGSWSQREKAHVCDSNGQYRP